MTSEKTPAPKKTRRRGVVTIRRARGGKGAFVPTDDNRKMVRRLCGLGISREAIAIHLGMSKVSLEKHFAHELKIAKEVALADAMERLLRMAENGNFSAAKAIYDRANGTEAEVLLERQARRDAIADAKKKREDDAVERARRAMNAGRVGKKEAQLQKSEVAAEGTDWEGLIGSGSVN